MSVNWHIGIAIARVVCLLLLLGCSNSDEALNAVAASDVPPVQQIENGRFQYSEKGEVMHVLTASTLRRVEDGTAEKSEDLVEVSNGFELFLGGDEQDYEAHIQAQTGWLDEKNLRLVAKDQVVLRNVSGDVLETEYLVWAEDSDRVWTNRPVMITSKDGILYGEGLESDARFENYRILHPSGEIVLEGMEMNTP
ncbi:MAG: LPS export ABC transporter periplasmic protein LptC [Bacteroidetes bacterium]|nr:LPS export ABC transporter periplasmic protein LptC [Bacteroidota bacterium]